MSPPARSLARLATVGLCFLASGAAGLLYQTLWVQRFCLVFGAGEPAVAVVLAAFMGGLALGARLVRTALPAMARPLRVYAILEVGVAALALLVEPGLWAARSLQAALFAGPGLPQDEGAALRLGWALACAAVLLAPATAAMGATLPVLARAAVSRDEHLASRVGGLYVLNTLGAAAGALLGPYVVLPRWGQAGALAVAVTLNLAAAGGAALLSRAGPSAGGHDETPRSILQSPRWPLALTVLTGALTFGFEIVWTRLLTHVAGNSVQAFGSMLAALLVSLAAGGAVAARVAPTRERARQVLALALAGIAVTSAPSLWLLDRLVAQLPARASPAWAAAISTLPFVGTAMCLGACFPLVVRVLARNAAEAGPASSHVLAWNTMGAIAGSLLVALVALPSLGFAGMLRLGACLAALGGLAAALASAPRRIVWAPALGLVAAALPTSEPWTLLRHSVVGRELGPVRHFAVGRSATVLVTDHGHAFRLTANGLPESLIGRPGSRAAGLETARWLGCLPQLVRPGTKDVLAIGLGGGAMLEELPDSYARIDVVELEPEVIRANRVLAPQRRKDPLADPRIRVHLVDARAALTLGRAEFDAILSQPSHPWTAGSSHLFTREFFALARSRLRPQGVFVQWIGLAFVDEGLLGSLVATLRDVFGHVEGFRPDGQSLLLVASSQPLDVAENAARALDESPAPWRLLGIHSPEDALAVRAFGDPGARRLARGAPLNTDGRNRFQSRSPFALGTDLLRTGRADALLRAVDPLVEDARQGRLRSPLAAIARLLRQGARPRARSAAESLSSPVLREAAFGLTDLHAGHRAAARKRLWPALADPVARAAWIALEAPELRRGRASDLPEPRRLEEQAVLDGLLLEGQRATEDLRALDARLTLPPTDPLHVQALRLRIEWRLWSSDPGDAAAALRMLDSSLGTLPTAGDLLTRARCARAARDLPALLASLGELVTGLRRSAGRSEPLSQALPMLQTPGLHTQPGYDVVAARYRRLME